MSHTKSSTQPHTKGPAAIQPVQNLHIDRSPTYREVAYTMIKDAILAGQLEPGQPLIEEKLAGLLKISRTPVREALAILEHEGLLTSFYKRGLYVHSVTGYWIRFPVRDLDHLLLATTVNGEPLRPGHGYPVRMVAPGRRGFWWVKWVDRVELTTTPWWWQPPFPTG